MDIDGRRVRHLRELAGLAQVTLARQAGISKQHLSDIETGKKRPSPPVVYRLAKALGVSIADVVRTRSA